MGQEALENSASLVLDAKLLFEHSRLSRAYFLAVAAIEEAGKALIAFDATQRDLTNLDIQRKIDRSLVDHGLKITSAFVGWLEAASSKADAVEKLVKLAVDLQFGREAAMYVDFANEGEVVTTPGRQIRDIAARDALTIAEQCLKFTRTHLEKTIRTNRTETQDRFFFIKSDLIEKLFRDPDFWCYYISQTEGNNTRIEDIVVVYYDEFYKRKRKFKIA